MKGLIFTYVMTYGGAVVALFNPFIGTLIYICFSIIRPESLWHWAVPTGNYSRIVAIAMLIGWLVRGFGNWQFGRATGIVLLLLGFFAWATLSAIAAPNSAVAWSYVDALSKVVLPFLVGITTIDSVKRLRALAWVILASQGYVALEMNLAYYDGFNRIKDDGFGGMDNNCVAIAMVACTGLAFFVGLHEKKLWLRFIAISSCILMMHSVFLAFSRGGMLALILTSIVAFGLLPKKPAHFLIFAMVIAVGVRLAGTEVLERFGTTFVEGGQRDDSAEGRLRLWENCWDVMKRNPILGLGPDHWPLAAANFGWLDGKHAHSLWMQTGAELGFPGLFFLGGFYLLCAIRLWPVARNRVGRSDPWLSHLAQAVIASIFGFVIAAQFVTLLGLEVPFYIVLVGAGVLRLTSQKPVSVIAMQDNLARTVHGTGSFQLPRFGPTLTEPTSR